MAQLNMILNKNRSPMPLKVTRSCKHYGCHKAWLVAAGNLTPDPIDSIYSGVVSTRSLRLSIFLAKLNNMEVWGADIGDDPIKRPQQKNRYCWSRIQGITRPHSCDEALYGLKSSGLRWSQYMISCCS